MSALAKTNLRGRFQEGAGTGRSLAAPEWPGETGRRLERPRKRHGYRTPAELFEKSYQRCTSVLNLRAGRSGRLKLDTTVKISPQHLTSLVGKFPQSLIALLRWIAGRKALNLSINLREFVLTATSNEGVSLGSALSNDLCQFIPRLLVGLLGDAPAVTQFPERSAA